MASKKHDFSYTQNRERSWLKFDERVLEESTDTTVPLLERFNFVAIFTSNLDEFYMVRVGGLHDLSKLKVEPVDNKSNQTPSEQLEKIFAEQPRLEELRSNSFHTIEAGLKDYNIVRYTADTLTDKDRLYLQEYVDDRVKPILSPQIIDPRHPFPNLKNDILFVVYDLEDNDNDGESELGVVEVPNVLERIIELPRESNTEEKRKEFHYILLEDAIIATCDDIFGSVKPIDKTTIRVTRSAEIDPDEEVFEDEDDYRQHMKKVLKKRMRLEPVRLEIQNGFNENHVRFIRKELNLKKNQTYICKAPIDLAYVHDLDNYLPEGSEKDLLYTPFSPQPPASFDPNRSLMEQIYEKDHLLFYPYESMEPFLRLIDEAAFSPNVLSIKITLYRIAKQSKLAESLISAVENGKEVTVLMELRARFDEQNNIEWAERLEQAGCTVIYGSEGFKVHSKVCQITEKKDGKISRITQFGTGNYNEKTASLYSDFALMTADKEIGEDANRFFNNMSLTELEGQYSKIAVAPVSLKDRLMFYVDREIERAQNGEEAYVFMKMNSLTDRDVIDKLSKASNAGVRVELIIRGICCLLPDIEGKTENIEARSIVGRYLEHIRCYIFGSERDVIYCASADMMTRNTEHRVEIAFPIFDEDIKNRILRIIDIQRKDNLKARILTSEGNWTKVPREKGDKPLDSQQYFLEAATKAAKEAFGKNDQEFTSLTSVRHEKSHRIHEMKKKEAEAQSIKEKQEKIHEADETRDLTAELQKMQPELNKMPLPKSRFKRFALFIKAAFKSLFS